MNAVVEIQGVQYRVAEGDRVKVPLLASDAGSKLLFDKVLLLDEGTTVTVGRPVIAEAVVESTVQSHGKDKKVIIFKMRRRKDYRLKKGHRQPYTLIQIDSIKAPGIPSAAAAVSQETEPEKKE